MTEHEETVRKAAEEVTDSLGWPISRDGRVEFIAQLLTPFFAAARKEAREELLDELAGHLPSEFIRTLRSKPKEPAAAQRVIEAERAREEPTAAFDPDDAD